MNKLDYKAMSSEQLRQYILEHRNDEDAIHEAVLRIQQEGTETSSDEFIEVVKQRLQTTE
jgi:SOS response regulatory protein OraA/RecX